MRRREGREPAHRLHALALRRDRLATAALVRGHDDVHEPLEEVALRVSARPPRRLELLVRLEERAGTREGKAAFARRRPFVSVWFVKPSSGTSGYVSETSFGSMRPMSAITRSGGSTPSEVVKR